MFSPLQPLWDKTMLRLDYISCILTIISTVLVGRKMWFGWIVAGVNSLLICIIGARTDQFGFIPANVFCVALYSYNLWAWRKNSDYANHLRRRPKGESQANYQTVQTRS